MIIRSGEQTRDVAAGKVEKEDLHVEEQIGDNRKGSLAPPLILEIKPTEAASRSPSPLRLPFAEPVSFGPC